MLGIAVLAMSVQGCQETPTEPVTVTIEGLFSHLNIAMASTTSNGSTSRFSNGGQDARFQTEPSPNQFNILGPNTNVLAADWPIIQQLPITARWLGDGEINLGWPAVSDTLWPDLEVAGSVRFGNTWFGYPAGGDPNDWIAQHSEWVRRPHEVAGTTFPLVVKLLANEPCSDCPVAHWLAGPSRHTPNDPQYRRKTPFEWFRYGDMSPWVWTNANTPGPTGPPELTELHIFISGVTVLLADGTTLTFEDQIGDIELFALNGNPHQIANSAVPQGEFTSVSFVVDLAQSWVRAGGQVAVLNFGDPTIAVQGPWTVGTGSFTTVTLTIDIDASMTWNEADGSWTFAPVIVLTVTTG
jgi:hypothetical protein